MPLGLECNSFVHMIVAQGTLMLVELVGHVVLGLVDDNLVLGHTDQTQNSVVLGRIVQLVLERTGHSRERELQREVVDEVDNLGTDSLAEEEHTLAQGKAHQELGRFQVSHTC